MHHVCNCMSIDYLNYATEIEIRPHTPVTMCVVFFRFYGDAISGYTCSMVRIVTLSKTSALYCIRSSMAVSLSTAEDFSLLDSFTSILHKLATEEFASEILPRHRVIRQQIEALTQSTAELQSLCAVLHKKIYDVILCLTAQKGRQHSFQVALWPKFHVFRTQVALSIWKNEQHVTIPFLSRVSAENECRKGGTA